MMVLILRQKRDPPILAIKGGVVIRAGFDEVMGYYLEIDHGAGYLSRYQHCKELLIQEGDTVEQGSVVAYFGDSGWATGPHLHLSVSFEGSFFDPMELFGQLDYKLEAVAE